VPATALGSHFEQRLMVGAVVTFVLCAVPQTALIINNQLQFIFDPPLYQLHDHERPHDAVSITVPAAHSAQSPVVGIVPTVVPATAQQVALIFLKAKQLFEFPKFSPAHIHESRPVLLVATTPGFPGAQSFFISILSITVVQERAQHAAFTGLFA
jgi:hypothetical protein